MKDHSFETFYKQQPRADPKPEQRKLFSVAKADEERHMVFGWASVATLADGSTVEDYQKDILDIDELEEAVYQYVLYYRDGGEMHQRRGIGVLVESVVFTPEKIEAMGIPEGTVPNGWWLGLKITDDDVWAKVKDGTYSMFSIEGEAARVPVEETEEDTDGQTEQA